MARIIGIVILLSAVTCVIGQRSNARTDDQQRLRQEQEDRRNESISTSRLRSIGAQLYRGKSVPQTAIKDVRELYREPTEAELRLLQPHADDLVRYSALLQGQRSGLVRLVSDSGCGDGTKVLATSANCIAYPMPGHGAAYSFRVGNYRISRLADLQFAEGNFVASGILKHGILVGIGDIPLEIVDLNTAGLGHINSFQPVADMGKAVEVGKTLQDGLEKDGYYYAQEMRAVDSMTYVLRSVAYRGSIMRSVSGFVYDEMDFDKRRDVTVAFRIVRRHDDGGVTLLWKELARKTAPLLLTRREAEQTRVDGNKFLAKEH